MRRATKIVLMVLFIAAALYLGYNIIINQSFMTTRYEVESEKLENDFKGILLADLHEVEYGDRNSRLLDAIKEEKPDVIFIAGDLVNYDSTDFEDAINLLEDLGKIAPTYYGFGNHEFYLKTKGVFGACEDMKALDNVHVIDFGSETAEINGNKMKIGSFSIYPGDWHKYGKNYFDRHEDPESFFILMSHYPWTVPMYYPEASTDVVLCGHAHGGQIHLWDDVGLYVPENGWFLPYTSGMHDIQGTTLIVTRGLGDHTWIPRINNQPELVVIDFKAKQGE